MKKRVKKKMVSESGKYSETDLAIGSVFRSLRCSKGFSQEDAVGGEISIAQLSKFENGKTILSTHHFLAILENICTNMFEFQYAYNNYLNSRDILLFDTELSKAYMELNVVELKSILTRINRSNEMTPLKKRRLDAIRVKILINNLDPSYEVANEDKKYLETYFKNLKEWGQYDVLLLGHCINFFDYLTLYLLAKAMVSPTQSIIELHYVKHSIIQTLLNLITVFTDNQAFTLANEFIAYLEKSDIHEYYMFEKLTLIYNKAICAYKSGDSSAFLLMEKCKEILIFCKCFKTANMVEKEITDLKKIK